MLHIPREENYKPQDQHYIGGDFILKQTVDPEPGYAVKEIFFTQKEESLYAIVPKWPGKELIVKDFQATQGTTVTLLATDRQLQWQNQDQNLVIQMPPYDPNAFEPEHTYAYVLRISPVEK